MKKVYLYGLLLAASTAFSPAFSMGGGEGGVVVAAPGAVGVATPQAGCPKAFQGFFLGARIGYELVTGNHKIFVAGEDDDGGENSTFFKNRAGPHGLFGGIEGGYRHRWCNWMAGIGLAADWANTKA
jgi:hypothetical protein